MLRQIWAMTLKDLAIMFKDRGTLVTLFGIPVVFIFFMTAAGVGGGAPDRPFPIPIVDRDGGEVSRALLARFETAGSFEPLTEIGGRPVAPQDAEDLIRQGDYRVAMVIEKDFSEAVLHPAADQAQGPRITLLADPALSGRFMGPVKGAIAGIVHQTVLQYQGPRFIESGFRRIASSFPPEEAAAVVRATEQFLAGMTQGDPPAPTATSIVSLEQRAPQGMDLPRYPTPEQQTVPAYAIFGVFFIISVMASSLLQEKMEGTFRRLLAAPIPRPVLLAGKLLPYFLVNMFQIAIMFGFGVLVYGLDLGKAPFALTAVTITLSFSATGLGLLIATLGRSVDQVGGIAVLVSIVMAAAGGVFIPTFAMPEWLQTLAPATPHFWALQGFQDVMVRGFGLAEVVRETSILSGFGALFFALAIVRFRFDR